MKLCSYFEHSRCARGVQRSVEWCLVQCSVALITVHYNPLQPVDPGDFLVASLAGRYMKIENPVLLKTLQQFHANNFGVLDDLLTCMGTGEYPATALLNHSCNPNCLLRYQCSSERGPVAEIVALRDVQAGDELCHSYTDCSTFTAQRQQRLRSIYHFDCDCCLCQAVLRPAPGVINLKDHAEKLEELVDAPLRLRSLLNELRADSTTAAHPQPLFITDDLLHETRSTLSPELIRRQEQAEHNALAADSPADIRRAYSSLQHTEKALEQCVGPFHERLYQFRGKMLSTALLLAADGSQDMQEESIRLCRRLVSHLCLSLCNLPNHPLLGVQLFTLADLLAQQHQQTAQQTAQSDALRREAVQHYRWCGEILIKAQGRESRLVQHLQRCLSDVDEVL